MTDPRDPEEPAAGPAGSSGTPDEVVAFLLRHAPFDDLGESAVRRLVAAASRERFAPGALVLDAFRDPSVEVFVVLDGRVVLWNDAEGIDGPPDEDVGPGSLFGFSAMLTERSVGPRAVAADAVDILRVPGAASAPLFASRGGARFLAQHLAPASRSPAPARTYSTVDELLRTAPLLVAPATSVAEVARRMTENGTTYAAVPLDGVRGGHAIVTDALLRRRVLADGLSSATPVSAVMEPSGPVAVLGDSAVEVYLTMLERESDVQLVVDREGVVRGAVAPRDFAISPTSGSAALLEQLRRSASTEELQAVGRRVPLLLAELLGQGLTSGSVIAANSRVLDTIVRRSLDLVLAQHPELDPDAFTWLALGSNGRREALPSSDVDSAVAFRDHLPEADRQRFRRAFAEVDAVLAGAGLSRDTHGAAASKPEFSRTNGEWRAAGRQWLATPIDGNGAMFTSLLVDGRPIHGDPGLPEVSRVFGDLREHPGTMRLLLQESLAHRARWHSVVDVVARRADTFDLKSHALIPVVNIGRWAALSVGSTALPTTERLRAAAGSAILPEVRARTLLEVFEVLQRLRLRYQLRQLDAGERPSDVLVLDRISPIDRSIIEKSVREVSAVQRRMSNIAAYVAPSGWTAPEESDKG